MSLNAYEQKLILNNPNISITVLSRLIGCTQSKAANIRLREPIGRWFYKGKGLPFTHKTPDRRYKVNYKGVSIISTKFYDKALCCIDRLIECIDKEGFGRVYYKYTKYKPRGKRLTLAKEHRFALPVVNQIARKSDFKK